MKLPSEYLEEGWCQNVLWDDNGNVCLMGAAVKTFQSFTPGYLHFRKTCEQILGVPSIVAWNNYPSRTQEEVVDLARRAEVLMGLTPEMDQEWEVPTVRELQEVS